MDVRDNRRAERPIARKNVAALIQWSPARCNVWVRIHRRVTNVIRFGRHRIQERFLPRPRTSLPRRLLMLKLAQK
ncbi:hypothetical protein [Aurantimonas sp. 22II-16-19i]|uniref:hypothetical protein n=1 Tax=Aurantimonas sp. 22II-16-19i TaxID=1317114 RepID=UPI0009F7A43E|nr:hypothetical protein [Aurantimonas sp. 22II-16-19i]ORE91900.1 hypothetical protein ATO4_18324 [Aurantimonas sp. 22II-16-19i]